MQTDNVAGPGVFNAFTVLRHKGDCPRKLHLFADAVVLDLHAALEPAGTYAHKGNSVAVGGVHVCLNLENNAGKIFFKRIDHAFACGAFRHAGDGAGGKTHKSVEQFLNAEIVDRAAKKHRRLLALEVQFLVKRKARAFQQVNLRAQLLGGVFTNQFDKLRIVQSVDDQSFLGAGGLFAVLRKKTDGLPLDVVHALKALAHANGPGHGGGLNAQGLLNIAQEVKGVTAFAVKLVDKGQNGRVAHAAHFHELAGLRFNALDRVNDHEGGVHSREYSVGVF